MQIIEADRWCEDSLREYEVTSKELEELRDAPKSEGESTLLKSARITRAETKVATATIKADVAMLVQQIMAESKRGSIAIDVPEAQLNIKLEWNK